jgi:hypothetical protein
MENVKEKRVLSPEHLEKLKISREKALAVRQKRAQEKKLEKELATKEHEQKINGMKERLEDISKPKKKVVKPDSDTESETAEPIVVKKKLKKKPKKIVIVEDSDTDEEQQQVIFVKRKKEPLPVPQQIQQPIQQIQQPIQQIEQPQVSRRRDPNEIYAEHYQRNGFQRRY